jgi:hypothetical protein
MSDLERELFDNEDEIIIDEPVAEDARFKLIQKQREEILNLKFKLKQKNELLSDLWGRYYGCRDVISFLIKDGDQRLDDLENHWSV